MSFIKFVYNVDFLALRLILKAVTAIYFYNKHYNRPQFIRRTYCVPGTILGAGDIIGRVRLLIFGSWKIHCL